MEPMQKPVVNPAATQAPFPTVMPAHNKMPHMVSPAYDNAHIKQMPVAGAYNHVPCYDPFSDTALILVLFILLVIIIRSIC
ncbi:MAG: hypothetical protein K0Q73_5652 [Paenibacillus sp.]|nr:hypothetical protein [Paenibacillus sp.]